MVNSTLIIATLKSIEEILEKNDIPYELEENHAYKRYMEIWNESDEQEIALRQARPAIRRITEKEPYLFLKDGAPLEIKFNEPTRKLRQDSFGEIFLGRPDRDWQITFSVKSDARVPAVMPVADRDSAEFMHEEVGVYNEIDDFGMRIFGIPCSNDYFMDMNAILEQIEPRDRATWARYLKDDNFAYNKMIFPMLRAISAEMPRLCKNHPEAPRKLLDYFYGTNDYYFINPIEEVGVTRIGAVNVHGRLGQIPDNPNLYVPSVKFPAELLDVRFATGPYGELSRDTVQFSFDGGWAVCMTILLREDPVNGRDFAINVYLPVTPFGSYRDQVAWDTDTN